MTTSHLNEVLYDLKNSEKQLSDANKDLNDSINYAKHIQNAFTVQTDQLKKRFPESFVFDKPKNVLSGDFVWAHDSPEQTYLGVGDCTGHGVPGAMLSVFMVSVLNQIVNMSDQLTPADILKNLDKQIQAYLYQNSERINDSAEISLIQYDAENQKLLYSAANRPLIHIRNGVVTTYKGSKYVLGDSIRRFTFVKNVELDLQKNDMLYMYSDGFVDQFGGPKNKKYLTKRLLTLLREIADLRTEEQYEIVESTFCNWQGNNIQIDDVLLLGIRI